MARRKFPNWVYYLDRNIEHIIIFPMYFAMMLIMTVDAVRHHIWNTHYAWGSYTCILLFVWFSWLGCSYNVKQRGHFRLRVVRDKLPRKIQFALLMLEYALWAVYSFVCIYLGYSQIEKLKSIGSLVYGTDWLPMWILPACFPIGFSLLLFRVGQCAHEDIQAMRTGVPLWGQSGRDV